MNTITQFVISLWFGMRLIFHNFIDTKYIENNIKIYLIDSK